jgi:hypothetical protein
MTRFAKSWRPERTRQLEVSNNAIIAAAGLILVVLGAGIAPVVMLGIIGLPAMIAGVVMFGVAVDRVWVDHGASRGTDALGHFLVILASLGIGASALQSTMVTANYAIARNPRLPQLRALPAGTLALTIAAWLLVPTIVAGAIFLRTGWRGHRLAVWWLLTFSAQPAAVLTFIAFAASGAPLTA